MIEPTDKELLMSFIRKYSENRVGSIACQYTGYTVRSFTKSKAPFSLGAIKKFRPATKRR